MSYPYRDGLTGAEAAAHAISIIDKQVGASQTAAVIIEPIQGEGGFIVPRRASCRRCRTGAPTTGSCSSPTRSRPASPGLGAIATIEELGLVDRAAQLGTVLLDRLRAMASRHPVIGDVRGRGAMVAIEFVRPGTMEPAADVCAAVARAAHAAGVVILTCGTYGHVIRLLPPLVIPLDLLHEGLDVLDEAIGAVTA